MAHAQTIGHSTSPQQMSVVDRFSKVGWQPIKKTTLIILQVSATLHNKSFHLNINVCVNLMLLYYLLIEKKTLLYYLVDKRPEIQVMQNAYC